MRWPPRGPAGRLSSAHGASHPRLVEAGAPRPRRRGRRRRGSRRRRLLVVAQGGDEAKRDHYSDDGQHDGRAASRAAGLTLVTTEFVLIELADALCKPQYRQEVLALCEVVETDPAFRVVRATSELIQRGRKLYRESADKEWPLTDCISFVVMKDQGLAEALTADQRFEQAGFKALLS